MSITIMFITEPSIIKRPVLLSGFVATGETISCEFGCSEDEALRLMAPTKMKLLFFAVQRIGSKNRQVPYMAELLVRTLDVGKMYLEIRLEGIADDRGTTISLSPKF